jgi:hypothetical protein
MGSSWSCWLNDYANANTSLVQPMLRAALPPHLPERRIHRGKEVVVILDLILGAPRRCGGFASSISAWVNWSAKLKRCAAMSGSSPPTGVEKEAGLVILRDEGGVERTHDDGVAMSLADGVFQTDEGFIRKLVAVQFGVGAGEFVEVDLRIGVAGGARLAIPEDACSRLPYCTPNASVGL